MDEKYKKYYDKLNGKDYSSYVSKYKTALSTIKTKFNSLEATISSPRWTEKGVNLIKTTVIPSLKNQANGIESGLGSLENACTQVKALVNKLETLKSLCNSLDNAKSAYNNAAEEEKASKKENVDYYQERVTKTEQEIDTIISAINGITVDIKDESVSFAQSMETLKEYNSLEALKQEFLGDVNDTSQYYDSKAYKLKARPLVCFDNTTGQIYKEGDTIYMKPGETRVLTVKLPNDSGNIKRIIRTTADGDSNYRSKRYVTAVSDVNPDPNKVDYVNYKSWSNHWPDNVDLHTNNYDWIVTATNEGTVQISQTCEFENTTGSIPKCMVDLSVVVKS